MKEEVAALVRYRLQAAQDSLEEAEILLKGKKHRGAMNRVYYSMFYATLALLATRQLGAAKHSGVMSLFHKEFVKEGVFPKEVAKFLNIAFDLRTKSDYKDVAPPDKERVEELLGDAKVFVAKSREVAEELLSMRNVDNYR
jgi:uncharacterized protein (UPF0332 family)